MRAGMVLAVICWTVIVLFCSGCGLVNPGSKGYLSITGDANGVNAFTQAFSHQDKYWQERALEEKEETVRQTRPSWLSGLFGGTKQ